jgi:hypothetical protein
MFRQLFQPKQPASKEGGCDVDHVPEQHQNKHHQIQEGVEAEEQKNPTHVYHARYDKQNSGYFSSSSSNGGNDDDDDSSTSSDDTSCEDSRYMTKQELLDQMASFYEYPNSGQHSTHNHHFPDDYDAKKGNINGHENKNMNMNDSSNSYCSITDDDSRTSNSTFSTFAGLNSYGHDNHPLNYNHATSSSAAFDHNTAMEWKQMSMMKKKKTNLTNNAKNDTNLTKQQEQQTYGSQSVGNHSEREEKELKQYDTMLNVNHHNNCSQYHDTIYEGVEVVNEQTAKSSTIIDDMNHNHNDLTRCPCDDSCSPTRRSKLMLGANRSNSRLLVSHLTATNTNTNTRTNSTTGVDLPLNNDNGANGHGMKEVEQKKTNNTSPKSIVSLSTSSIFSSLSSLPSPPKIVRKHQYEQQQKGQVHTIEDQLHHEEEVSVQKTNPRSMDRITTARPMIASSKKDTAQMTKKKRRVKNIPRERRNLDDDSSILPPPTIHSSSFSPPSTISIIEESSSSLVSPSDLLHEFGNLFIPHDKDTIQEKVNSTFEWVNNALWSTSQATLSTDITTEFQNFVSELDDYPQDTRAKGKSRKKGSQRRPQPQKARLLRDKSDDSTLFSTSNSEKDHFSLDSISKCSYDDDDNSKGSATILQETVLGKDSNDSDSKWFDPENLPLSWKKQIYEYRTNESKNPFLFDEEDFVRKGKNIMKEKNSHPAVQKDNSMSFLPALETTQEAIEIEGDQIVITDLSFYEGNNERYHSQDNADDDNDDDSCYHLQNSEIEQSISLLAKMKQGKLGRFVKKFKFKLGGEKKSKIVEKKKQKKIVSRGWKRVNKSTDRDYDCTMNETATKIDRQKIIHVEYGDDIDTLYQPLTDEDDSGAHKTWYGYTTQDASELGLFEI